MSVQRMQSTQIPSDATAWPVPSLVMALVLSAISASIALIGLFAGYYYFRSQTKRNKLVISSNGQVLIASTRPDDLHKDFRVTYQGNEVAHPYILVIEIENAGPKDIQSDHFDQSRPITLSPGVPIIATGPTGDSPNALRNVVEGDVIKLGPDLISRESSYSLTMIVDGTPNLTLKESAVTNCDVRVNPSASRFGKLPNPSKVAAMALALAAIIGIWGTFLHAVAPRPDDEATAPRSTAEQRRIELVIARAEEQVQRGVPVAWGGGDEAGPTKGIHDGGFADLMGDYNKIGFDCSGLIVYAFAAIGYSLPHYSGYQYSSGPRVDFSKRERGDLIFWGKNGTESVAIYLGNDQVVVARKSGELVKDAGLDENGITPFVVRLR